MLVMRRSHELPPDNAIQLLPHVRRVREEEEQDMTATDELRRLLDKRGVKYRTYDRKYLKETCWPYMGELMAYFVEFDNGTTRFELVHWCFTPEQAIAATPGEEKAGKKSPPKGGPGPCGQPSDDIIHDAATLGSGTLTAEQVMSIAGKHQSDYCLDTLAFFDWQAIADELNAAMGDDGYKQAADYWEGMYEELLTERIGEERDYPEHNGRHECPECGNVVYYDELYGGGWTIYVEDYQIPFNACPNCGEAVER